ncbi:FAD-dependent oxidoreductase [Kribbella speibonae]|uniref:FAD-dependent oxidoreductase n=1 Tax=Kribbella speibonae TaxID=1572660 RepID=UPI0023D94707|nr:FAD-dependent oxidoreductase [Kribbella speibonae]
MAAFGSRAADPVRFVEKDWMNERFIAGVQAAVPPGLITEAGSSMLTSKGPLHWCSSEQGTRWALTMNGAVESGDRIAANIIELIK